MTEVKNTKWIKPLLILAVIAAVLVLGGKYSNLQQHLISALEWIKGLGPVSPRSPRKRWRPELQRAGNPPTPVTS